MQPQKPATGAGQRVRPVSNRGTAGPAAVAAAAGTADQRARPESNRGTASPAVAVVAGRTEGRPSNRVTGSPAAAGAGGAGHRERLACNRETMDPLLGLDVVVAVAVVGAGAGGGQRQRPPSAEPSARDERGEWRRMSRDCHCDHWRGGWQWMRRVGDEGSSNCYSCRCCCAGSGAGGWRGGVGAGEAEAMDDGSGVRPAVRRPSRSPSSSTS